MRTELPAQRLHRRLGGESEAERDDDDDRQPDTSLTRWLPEATSGAPSWLSGVRADPGRAGVMALTAVGVIAVLVTVFALVRDKSPAVASAKLPPVQTVSSTGPAPTAPPADAPVVISVVGLVHKPGLVTLDAGARIADALDAAGGPLDGADLLGLNMARRVTDGEQIVVGIAAPPGEPVAMGSSVGAGGAEAAPPDGPATGGGGEAVGPVNLNTATVAELDTLPGIGPVTAAAIIAWRDANGQFTSVDQLGDVDGIGPARLAKLRDLVHV